VRVDAETVQGDALEPYDAPPATAEAEAAVAVEAPEAAQAPAVAETTVAGDRLSPEQLCDYLARAHFPTVLGRRGYQQDEVDAFLVTLADQVRAGEPLHDLVRGNRFSTVRLEDGYDPHQVDDFLAAVVDLDPHSDGQRPEPARGGLMSRLFG
jgi:DivIVA domain-containing protein